MSTLVLKYQADYTVNRPKAKRGKFSLHTPVFRLYYSKLKKRVKMSLNFEQLAQLKHAIYSKNRSGLNEEDRERQFDKIFKYFEAQMRYSYEYEKGRNIYSVESKSAIPEEEMSGLVKDIINLQSKHHLHRKDKVLLSYFEIPRNYNTDTYLYKIEIRKGKNLAHKGPDMFLGQLLVRGTADWNQDKPDHKRVYISPDIPFCDRKKADNMKMTARAIRESGTGNVAYFTRLDVQHDQRQIELLVKKKTGKKSGKWQKVDESDIHQDLKDRYLVDQKTPRQLYTPKTRRVPRNPANAGNTGNQAQNRNGDSQQTGNARGRGGAPPNPQNNGGNGSQSAMNNVGGASPSNRGRPAHAGDPDTPSPLRRRRESTSGRRDPPLRGAGREGSE